jgi:DNA-binding Lrp family transcriptional regulator
VFLLAQYHPKGEMKRHVRAFISVATALGKESAVADALWNLEEVKEVHIIPGRQDILAIVEVSRHLLEPDSQSIYWFILDKLKGIPSIVDTETLVPIMSMSKWSS